MKQWVKDLVNMLERLLIVREDLLVLSETSDGVSIASLLLLVHLLE